ncbi:MAG: hypothetical protein AVDCRST_MAG85-1545, partial [uncultured Solirubrobacteraceae bacterium]
CRARSSSGTSLRWVLGSRSRVLPGGACRRSTSVTTGAVSSSSSRSRVVRPSARSTSTSRSVTGTCSCSSARTRTRASSCAATTQPEIVREAVERVRPKDWFRRRNSAGLRQGEWFFVPAPGLAVPDELVLRDGPLSRGWGKFHRLELAHRRGGVNVYVNAEHPTGITEQRFRNLQSAARR